MFEDWSPSSRAKDGDKDRSPGGQLSFVSPTQVKSTRAVVVLLSLVAIVTGASCWRQFVLLDVFPAAGASARTDSAFNASNLRNLDHLVLVAGHAVVMAEDLGDIDQNEQDWYLEPYQIGQDLPGALVGHIQSGVEIAAADPKALLVFSGGQTRPDAGPRDEGSSYYRVAEHFHWWGHTEKKQLRLANDRFAEPQTVAQRTVTEDFASDSFQNLLFSLCRFKEVVGHYPARVTVVSFNFKRRRFQDLHRLAVRFPLDKFFFTGIQPSENSNFDVEKAQKGELENSLRLFEADPYGCHTKALVAKRAARNPFRRTTPYALSCSEMAGLLEWCGPGLYHDSLPWDQ